MSLSKSKDLKRKRIDAPEPADPIEDDNVMPPVAVDENPNIDDLADVLEINDLESMAKKLDDMKTTIEKMKDNKVRPVWASLHKLWYSMGHLKNELNNVRHTSYEQDKYEGMCRRLYAWMKHMENVDKKFALPERAGLFKK